MKPLLLASLILLPGLFRASAAVADSSASGFTVKIVADIKAPPAEVYRRLVHNVGDWWNSQHTFSGNAHNLSIDDKPMGCFCEALPDGGGARHMEVVRASPGKTLVLLGGLGPLQAVAAAGSMTFRLAATEEGSKLTVTYTVTGYLPGGMQVFAAPVDEVLGDQIARLKNYVEHGDPAPK